MTLDPTSRRWPMKSSLSSGPISSTTPTSSWPSVNGQGSGLGQWPLRMWRSVPQTPQAATRMSAALGGTSGLGTSRITGGSPGPSKVVTRTVCMGPPPGSERGGTSTTPTQQGANRPRTERLRLYEKSTQQLHLGQPLTAESVVTRRGGGWRLAWASREAALVSLHRESKLGGFKNANTRGRTEEHTSEIQARPKLVFRLFL